MSSMASYTAPLLFGVDQVMTMQIVNAKTNGDLRFASVVAVMLAIISIAFLIVIRGYERRTIYRSQSKGGARKQHRITSRFAKTIVFVVAGVSTTFLILPIAMIFVLAFAVNGSWRSAPLPSQYTLQNILSLFTEAHAWEPIRNSLEMSAIAVIGTVV